MTARYGLFFLLLPLIASCAPERVNPDRVEWMQATQQRIAANTHVPFDPLQPDKPRSGIVIVRINVSENGNIFTPVVAHSSGDSMVDNAALVSVLAANPLPPPPLARGKRVAEVFLPVVYSLTPEATAEMEAKAWEIMRAIVQDRSAKAGN